MADLPELHLSGCTYTWLHHEPLESALRSMAEHGFQTFELTTASPHAFAGHLGPYERHQLTKTMKELGLAPISVNSGYVDINVVSTNPELQRLSVDQLRREIELAHDVGARFVVLIPGRAHQLSPAPQDAMLGLLEDVLHELVPRAEELDVVLTLENSPYGFLGRATDQLAVVDRIDSAHLGLTYDVANALALEDPVEGVRGVAPRLRLAHVSDTWRDRWAHTSIGRGEVDFAAFAHVLAEVGFTGTTVYELVDGEPPGTRLRGDLAALAAVGWRPDGGQGAAE